MCAVVLNFGHIGITWGDFKTTEAWLHSLGILI